MKTLPTLYRKNNNNSIQQWTIKTEEATIITEYGIIDGKLQTTKDTISSGKNEGKKNATTPVQQAEAEALAKWTKQLRLGYVDSIKKAENEQVDALVEGGVDPMLAPSKIYPHFAKKLTFPVLTQPKLDGSRLIAVLKDGVCTLWSRTRKRINSLPHVAKAVEEHFGNQDVVLDGEAWNKEVAIREGFEGLMSLIRNDEPKEGHEQIGYYIYDLPADKKNNILRDEYRLKLLKNAQLPLVAVESVLCHTHEDIVREHLKHVEEGYEGTMIRNDGPYEGGKRSYHLQKFKDMEDHEFKIIGVEEGRGKDVGTVGAFICSIATKEFRCSLNATYQRRKELFKHPEQWQDFKLTVRHQGHTLDGIPRFPKGKGLRKDTE
jgi:ATP-dependent DNA ligase